MPVHTSVGVKTFGLRPKRMRPAVKAPCEMGAIFHVTNPDLDTAEADGMLTSIGLLAVARIARPCLALTSR